LEALLSEDSLAVALDLALCIDRCDKDGVKKQRREGIAKGKKARERRKREKGKRERREKEEREKKGESFFYTPAMQEMAASFLSIWRFCGHEAAWQIFKNPNCTPMVATTTKIMKPIMY
jgi:hypothetical protein